jgi:uncharacterized FlaG/YvyC family protein
MTVASIFYPLRADPPAAGAHEPAEPRPAMTGAGAGSPPDAAQVRQAVAQANQSLARKDTQMEFVFDDQIHQTLVKIVDSQTREVVGQIPSEAMLAAARALAAAWPRGAIVDTRA